MRIVDKKILFKDGKAYSNIYFPESNDDLQWVINNCERSITMIQHILKDKDYAIYHNRMSSDLVKHLVISSKLRIEIINRKYCK